MCKRKRFHSIMCDMQILLAIEVSVLCLATNGTLGDFAYHLFCVIFVIFSVCFVVTFEKFNNHKNITVFEKDSLRLLKIIFRSFNALHVMHANTYLHTLCTKNIDTFYPSKDSCMFFVKFMNNSVMLACKLVLSGRGNSFSFILTLNLKDQDIGALKESYQ